VRAYVSTVFGCPYEGEVSVEPRAWRSPPPCGRPALMRSLWATRRAWRNPRQVGEVIAAMHAGGACRSTSLAMHMHDTKGAALANVLAGLQAGVRTFDGSDRGRRRLPLRAGRLGQRRL
jgi:hydroxymethylglutaryl-CoA lyase